MNARQERKRSNLQRRQALIVLGSLRKPESSASRRLRFEELHDQWRKAAGLQVGSRLRGPGHHPPGGKCHYWVPNR